MRNRAITAFAALAFALASAGAAAQQTPEYDPRAAFLEADTNGNGGVELNEFYNRLVEIYFLGDVNKDGTLDHAEFVKVTVTKDDFASVDQDSDGKVSRKEFVSHRVEMFFVLDIDDDGELSVSEVVAAYEVGGAK